jgi:hypothetical protein
MPQYSIHLLHEQSGMLIGDPRDAPRKISEFYIALMLAARLGVWLVFGLNEAGVNLSTCKSSIEDSIGYIGQGFKGRPCKIITLKDTDPCLIQPMKLVCGFHAFGNNFNSQVITDLLHA